MLAHAQFIKVHAILNCEYVGHRSDRQQYFISKDTLNTHLAMSANSRQPHIWFMLIFDVETPSHAVYAQNKLCFCPIASGPANGYNLNRYMFGYGYKIKTHTITTINQNNHKCELSRATVNWMTNGVIIDQSPYKFKFISTFSFHFLSIAMSLSLHLSSSTSVHLPHFRRLLCLMSSSVRVNTDQISKAKVCKRSGKSIMQHNGHYQSTAELFDNFAVFFFAYIQ